MRRRSSDVRQRGDRQPRAGRRRRSRKALGQPVHRLLGGRAPESFDAYASAFYYGGEWQGVIEAEARDLLARGYRHFKMKVGTDLRSDIECVHRARAALGPEVRLAADANRGYTRRDAIAISGLVVGGVLLACVALTDSPIPQFTLICLGLGYFTAAYTPNIWAIAVTDLPAHVVGPATGIINGFGAGGGGIVAATGTGTLGLSILGLTAILGGVALFAYARTRPSAAGGGTADTGFAALQQPLRKQQ